MSKRVPEPRPTNFKKPGETEKEVPISTHVDKRHEPSHGIILNRDLTLTLPAGLIDDRQFGDDANIPCDVGNHIGVPDSTDNFHGIIELC